ncbi:hypothetical protein P167DRAFT_534309 [Morchella conica CCBAS932]|uniref:Uncharacterized protein n=1 Tax=Morchella conica CCBAS932 TaxID=1392247 RepID=A0A3N4KUA1_9PEZI|nr:hypothetical protein P167DRAFT_534309 [Morchella conica CCBAS932]
MIQTECPLNIPFGATDDIFGLLFQAGVIFDLGGGFGYHIRHKCRLFLLEIPPPHIIRRIRTLIRHLASIHAPHDSSQLQLFPLTQSK